MVKIILLVLLSEIITVVGQILFKKSANTVGKYDLKSARGLIRFLSEIVRVPYLWLGFLAMAMGLVAWLLAIAQGDLSLVFPIGSIQYIFILFLAHKFLDEKIDAMKFIGTLLVMAGIVLISVS